MQSIDVKADRFKQSKGSLLECIAFGVSSHVAVEVSQLRVDAINVTIVAFIARHNIFAQITCFDVVIGVVVDTRVERLVELRRAVIALSLDTGRWEWRWSLRWLRSWWR